jgi:glucokinase
MNSHSLGGLTTPDMGLPTAIGVDLGGTRFKVGWLSAQYELHAAETYPTLAHRSVDDVLIEIANAITTAREAADSAGHSIGAVGIGMAAVIDPNAGKIVLAPNFSQSWQRFPLASALQRMTSLPVYLLNDARSHLLAEWRAGAARNIANVLGITLGTGVGGGLVLDGRLRLGPHCLAGEFGHLTCDPHGLRCGCGSFGCVETYASGTAIAAAALRPLLQGRAPRLREVLGGDSSRLDAQAVAEAALLGDTECREIFVRAGEALGIGIANVMKIVEIERVVIGGGVAAAEQLLFDAIRRSIRRHCTVFEGCEPDLTTATVAQPGATGAAIWARERMNVMTGLSARSSDLSYLEGAR